mgnify:CR=1 FL=1
MPVIKDEPFEDLGRLNFQNVQEGTLPQTKSVDPNSKTTGYARQM